jgi:beta-lactamase regulating signal transducer with metallopeptidase domain
LLLLRRETFHRFKRSVLLGIIFIAILVPLIKLRVDPVMRSSLRQEPEPAFARFAPAVFSEQKPAALMVVQTRSNTLSIITLIYLAGASVQVLLIFYSLARILLLIRKSRKIKYQGFRLALVPSEVVPFCFGRHIIISEDDFRKNAKEIILHEQTHMKEIHGMDLFLSELYLTMTWYNPVSWLIRHELKQTHEFAADRNVLRQGFNATEYQLLLVRKVAGETRFKLANQFSQSNIKTRITMMNKRRSSPVAILKVLIFIPLIALMVQLFAQKEVKMSGNAAKESLPGTYLQLTPEQFKLLGFEINPSGLFYKNTRGGRPDRGILCLYFTEEMNNGSIILNPGEEITGNSIPENSLKKQTLTNYDFYPVVVAHFNGFRNQDMSPGKTNQNEQLLPVQINMAGLKLGKRADTLVFWFKPTTSLKNVLSPIADINDYLQRCPESPSKPDIKAKSH